MTELGLNYASPRRDASRRSAWIRLTAVAAAVAALSVMGWTAFWMHGVLVQSGNVSIRAGAIYATDASRAAAIMAFFNDPAFAQDLADHANRVGGRFDAADVTLRASATKDFVQLDMNYSAWGRKQFDLGRFAMTYSQHDETAAARNPAMHEAYGAKLEELLERFEPEHFK